MGKLLVLFLVGMVAFAMWSAYRQRRLGGYDNGPTIDVEPLDGGSDGDGGGGDGGGGD